MIYMEEEYVYIKLRKSDVKEGVGSKSI